MKVGDFVYSSNCWWKYQITRETAKQWILDNGSRIWKKDLTAVGGGSTWHPALPHLLESEVVIARYNFYQLQKEYREAVNKLVLLAKDEKDEKFMRTIIAMMKDK